MKQNPNLKEKDLENTMGTEENAGPSIFSFPTVFSTLSKREILILATFDLSSANAFKLVKSKILSNGKGLINNKLKEDSSSNPSKH